MEEKGQPFSNNTAAGNKDGVPYFVYSANSKTHLRLTRSDQWNFDKWQMGLFANHAPASSPLSNGVIVAHHYRAGSWKVRIKTTKRIAMGTEIRVPYNNYTWVRSWKPCSQFCDLIFSQPNLPPRPTYEEIPFGSPIVSLVVFRSQGERGLTAFNTQYFLPLIALLSSLARSPLIQETGTKTVIFYDDSIEELPQMIATMADLPIQPTFVLVDFGLPWRKGSNRLGHKGHLMSMSRLCVSSWCGIDLALIRDINYSWSSQEEQAFRTALMIRKTQGRLHHTIWRPANYTEARPNLSGFNFISPPDNRLHHLLINALKLESFGGLGTLGSHLLKPSGPPYSHQITPSSSELTALSQTARALLKIEGNRLLKETQETDSFLKNLERISHRIPPKNFTLNWLLNNIRPEQNSPAIVPGGHWGCDEYVMALWVAWSQASPTVHIHELTHPFDHRLDGRSLPAPTAQTIVQPTRPLSPHALNVPPATPNVIKTALSRQEKKRKLLEKLKKARAIKSANLGNRT